MQSRESGLMGKFEADRLRRRGIVAQWGECAQAMGDRLTIRNQIFSSAPNRLAAL